MWSLTLSSHCSDFLPLIPQNRWPLVTCGRFLHSNMPWFYWHRAQIRCIPTKSKNPGEKSLVCFFLFNPRIYAVSMWGKQYLDSKFKTVKGAHRSTVTAMKRVLCCSIPIGYRHIASLLILQKYKIPLNFASPMSAPPLFAPEIAALIKNKCPPAPLSRPCRGERRVT